MVMGIGRNDILWAPLASVRRHRMGKDLTETSPG